MVDEERTGLTYVESTHPHQQRQVVVDEERTGIPHSYVESTILRSPEAGVVDE